MSRVWRLASGTRAAWAVATLLSVTESAALQTTPSSCSAQQTNTALLSVDTHSASTLAITTSGL